MSQRVLLASKTLPETSTQCLSNDLFWDPVDPPQATAKLSRPQEELRSRAPPSSPAEELMMEMLPLWKKCCFTAIAPEAGRQKQRKSCDPPGRLAIYFVTKGILNPQINHLGPSIINSWRQATIFEPKDPPFS